MNVESKQAAKEYSFLISAGTERSDHGLWSSSVNE